MEITPKIISYQNSLFSHALQGAYLIQNVNGLND